MTSTSQTDLGERLRGDFPVLASIIDDNPVIYLDSAATALKPKKVIDALVHYYADVGANIHRGKHYLSEEASNDFERGRARVAQLIGAMGNEIVFVRNTTEALNLVAGGLSLRPEDRVVVALSSHHSHLLPWRKHASVEMVRLDGQGCVDLNHYQSLLKHAPKVVALTHCSNVTGAYEPVAEMARMAKEAGAIVVVDAAQSVPHTKINVREIDVDFLAFSGHKMLGPTGIGVLYGKGDLLATLEPTYLGGGTVDWVDEKGHRLRKVPHRFEAGTPDIAGVYGLTAAVSYLQRVGFPAIEEHDAALSALLLEEAAKRSFIEIIGPTAPDVPRTAIVSMRLRGIDSLGDVARALSDSYGIMCRTGHLCAQPLVDSMTDGEVLRASAYLYNSRNEIEQFFQALDELVKRLSA